MELKQENIIDISNFLPHRAPMLMADYILDLTPESVQTSFEIKPDNIFLQGNLFTEVGLIEHSAQTCSSILGQSFYKGPNEETKLIGFITNIKKIEVFKLPEVGKTIISRAFLISKYDKICNIFCETFCDEEILCRTEITLFIQEIES